MTTETFALPTSYTFGKVVGRIVYSIADTAEDVDDKPQARAAAGKVLFVPQVSGAKVTTGDYTAIVMNGTVSANLSSTGRILDAEGRQGVWLVTGIYKVLFDFTATSDGLRGTLPEFLIEVTADHTEGAPLDLASAAPASVPTGATVMTLVVPAGGAEGQILAKSATSGSLEWVDPEDIAGDPLPTGGTTGQALVKTSDANGAVGWGDVTSTVEGLSDATTVGKAVVKAADAAAARDAIGAQPAGSYATAAQGAKADTAVQPAALTTGLAGKADLVGGKVPASQIPDIAISEYLGAAANQAAMLALAGQKGDWATRTDLGTTWIITGTDPTQLSSWTALSYPAAPVLSVNGQTGSPTLEGITVAAAAKTTPVDADVMPVVDSAASNAWKKVTWANIKATLRAWLDSLYAAEPVMQGSTGNWPAANTTSATKHQTWIGYPGRNDPPAATGRPNAVAGVDSYIKREA